MDATEFLDLFLKALLLAGVYAAMAVGMSVVYGVMNMGCQIGGALTASLTPWIAAHFGWNSAFGAAAFLAVLGAGAWIAVDPRTVLREPDSVAVRAQII